MFLWTCITTGLGIGSIGSKNARIALVAWLVFSAALTALGGPIGD